MILVIQSFGIRDIHLGLDSMDEAESLAEFRFEKQHLHLLAEALRIPTHFTTRLRSRVDGMDVFC